jgi:hypothetical protein
MNRLSSSRRAQVVRCLIEGNSIRSTVRLTGVAKNTVVKLVMELGAACVTFMDRTMQNLRCRRILVNETWSLPGTGQKGVRPHRAEDGGCGGDIRMWTAVDADTKLIPRWMLGARDANAARAFIEDLASRMANRIHLTTEGLQVYLTAVDRVSDGDIDYAQLVKIYGDSPEGCEPDPKHIGPSSVVRADLSKRMPMGRFTGLTDRFSRKLENHAAAVAFYFMWYNFGRVHQALKTTPAVKAGVADHVWSVDEIVARLGNSN